MKNDKLISKRFVELADKAKEIEEKAETDTRGEKNIDNLSFQAWATSVLNLLQRIFGKDSVHYNNFFRHYNEFKGWEYQFHNCAGIFIAAFEDFEGGYLFNLKSLISAEISEDVLEQAEELLNSDYKDPACVLAGVALETSLKDLCSRQGIKLGKVDKMNADLRKAEAYNVGMQKQITAWAHHRNKAAHGEWGEYTSEDVKDMIKGVRRFIAEYL